MDFEQIKSYRQTIQFLDALPEGKRQEKLLDLDDQTLWDLWRLDYKNALIVLYKKYHRLVVIRLYKRFHQNGNISLQEVQDSFSEWMEKILNGKYKDEPLKKNFEAFAIYYTQFLIRKKIQRKGTNPTVSFEKDGVGERSFQYQLRVEKNMDFGKILDCIPLISNSLYRNLVYSIFIMGYTVSDLIPLFGKRDLAYDKKYRAMEAFKKILKREGLWEELK